jgi:hypothetical protein
MLANILTAIRGGISWGNRSVPVNTLTFLLGNRSAAWCVGGFLAITPMVSIRSVAAESAAQSVPVAAPAAVAAAHPTQNPVVNTDGYLVVGFDRLASFSYTPPELSPAPPATPQPSAANQIPERIRALDAAKVMVTGFMLPVKMDQGLVTEFLLVKDPMMCCYGIMPKLNEWVVVKMTGKGVAPLMDVPISFEGRLKVGEQYDNGYLTGIYLLEGEKQASPTKG